MARGWKVVIDSENAQEQAEFWAAALEYRVEDQSPLVARLRAAGQLPDEAIVEHRGRLAFRGFAAVRHPDDPFDEESDVGLGRRLLFQEVPERKTVKNRLHLDIHSGPGERERTVERLEARGARRVREEDQGPAGHWWVMLDPEGNEFCVS
ncbi:VOC family protein [Streptomyces triticirhizae]|uniref:Glyoxalase/bleomycin resistance/dioxygenase family protein n=1 Tax=Streptomyces triticirhizae TaxID=2483353 RepID=A0A3M2KWY5_9ACTN|nr:VOC family protein [Streptomyces triticirhizae]RMI28015.1 glyoxalase/bleomycin resistance/dioxygenase family protein [Streptomyces triticirhizae]